MKDPHRPFLRRKSVYYSFDTQTMRFESLKIKDKSEAQRLLAARLDAHAQHSTTDLRLATVYLSTADPKHSSRSVKSIRMDVGAFFGIN